MGREDQIIGERKRKITELKEQGINPYPHSYERKNTCLECLNSKEGTSVKTAGRLMTKRDLGKIAFANLTDESGTIQITLQEGQTSDETKNFFKKYTDTGDFVGVEGKIILTKTGQISILVKDIVVLSKAVLPLPEKFHGLKDKEERYRKRYIDLMMNPEVKDVFKKRSEIIKTVREFLDKKGFIEVETPLLQTQYGGANARPFVTKINAWNMSMYLSISPELYLKRLIVGGFEKVFTICKNFRNEGVDFSHNPEFTMIEIYQAYADYTDMMKLIEECWEYCAKKVLGTTKVKRTIDGKEYEIDFKAPWPRLTTLEAVQKYAGINADLMSDEELEKFCKDKKLKDYPVDGCWGEYLDFIYEEFVEKNLIQPTHIIDRPKEGTPLCKGHRCDIRLNEQCEPVGLGMELGNMYTELNDPEVQEELLKGQAEKGRGGDEEAHPMDDDFINALKTGMPPTGGIGWGIDRMIILFTGVESIRDIILFPTMKPEVIEEESKDKKKVSKK